MFGMNIEPTPSWWKGDFNPEDGGSIFLRNVGVCTQDCAMSQTTKPQNLRVYGFCIVSLVLADIHRGVLPVNAGQ
jgi:hypothetical protein